MPFPPRPHLLGIDDGPFQKRTSRAVPVVGVMMEGPDLVEAVALTRFPVDGEGVTDFLADWVRGLRFRPALQGVVLGGITIAGLAVVDVEQLARELEVPVLVVNRRQPTDERLRAALESAGLHARRELLERAPPAHPVGDRLYVAACGLDPDEAAAAVRASRNKSEVPEPLRLAHLIAGAVARGESRGRP
jgi:endonuclease V-like protein UPF0215 family